MARLEELTRSASVKGILPNQIVTVADVARKTRRCDLLFENKPIAIERGHLTVQWRERAILQRRCIRASRRVVGTAWNLGGGEHGC